MLLKKLIKKLDEEVEEETYSTEIVQTTLITRESTKIRGSVNPNKN